MLHVSFISSWTRYKVSYFFGYQRVPGTHLYIYIVFLVYNRPQVKSIRRFNQVEHENNINSHAQHKTEFKTNVFLTLTYH